jgi:hypothetical protein
MTVADTRTQVILVVSHHLGGDANCSGSVLYNGWHTLREGPIYLMGYNPGGNPDQITTKIIESLEELPENHCAYEDEKWTLRGTELPKGEHPHQKRVKALAGLLGLDIRTVFAVNAIFQRSPTASSLTEASEYWERC